MVAWLFSREHLTRAELDYAATRLRRGDRPDPSRALQEAAREAMGAQPAPLTHAAREPLSPTALLAVTAANIALTPLAGIAVWVGLREDRPRAARQALVATLPVFGLLCVAWMAVRLFRPWA